MSDDMIEMSDEVEGIIRGMDGVAADFPDDAPAVGGQRDGAAAIYVDALNGSRRTYSLHFRNASASLRKVVGIMREAAADQRKVESEIVDMLKRLEQDAEAPEGSHSAGKTVSDPGATPGTTPLTGKDASKPGSSPGTTPLNGQG